VNFLLDDLWPDPPPSLRQPPILPNLALGLGEIFVTDSNFRSQSGSDPRLGDFMPILEVSLSRRGERCAAVFSLS
jgi:hypothetical protein